jgi:cyclophilin family peptidyl-prolyl cis-trans isomerase
MAQGRNPKRARKKDRRNARREEWMREYRRRRRRRRFVLLGAAAAVVIAGLVVFFLVEPASKKHALASPTPSASTAPATSKNTVACGGTVPAAAHQPKKTYSAPVDQGLDPNTRYTWKLQTSCGEIDIGLDVKDSPKITNSIVFLTRQGFYDGLLFHRIAPNFVIQGGDPKGDGTGGPGYTVSDPIPTGFQYQEGTVAMAKSGSEPAGTAGSQFFIVTSATGGGQLTPEYGIVGKVLAGDDVVQKIAATGTQDGSPPTAYTYIVKATIVEG